MATQGPAGLHQLERSSQGGAESGCTRPETSSSSSATPAHSHSATCLTGRGLHRHSPHQHAQGHRQEAHTVQGQNWGRTVMMRRAWWRRKQDNVETRLAD